MPTSDFRPVLACASVAIKCQDTVTFSQMFNVFHVQTPAAVPTSADLTAAGTVFTNWCGGVYNQNFSNGLQIVEIRLKSLAASVAPFLNIPVSNTGTQGGYDEIDHAPLMLLHGDMSSRNEAGRVYAFSPGAGIANEFGYSAVYYVNMLAALNNLRAALGSAGLQLAVASEDTGLCYRVTSVGHTNRKTLQKRRRIGFGR